MEETWVTFTRRTASPKLQWLERELDKAGIPHRRAGVSMHAPIIQVQKKDLERAWDILAPVDDLSDTDKKFWVIWEEDEQDEGGEG